jgi:hypothetical protein
MRWQRRLSLAAGNQTSTVHPAAQSPSLWWLCISRSANMALPGVRIQTVSLTSFQTHYCRLLTSGSKMLSDLLLAFYKSPFKSSRSFYLQLYLLCQLVDLFLLISFYIPVFACVFVCALAEFHKATVSCVMSVRLSVPMEQLGSHWTDVHEI